jgi:cellulose biosynthesis protein BcsQ
MSSLETLVEILVNLVRRSPENLVAVAVTAAIFGSVWLWFVWRSRPLRKQIGKLEEEKAVLLETKGRLEAELRHGAEAAEMALKEQRDHVAALEQQVSSLTEQVQRLADFDGKIWEQRPCRPVPPFRQLSERKVPVIAVVNLKGGVGKTTIAANLGAVLAVQNRRVLLIDTDYQGTLTSLCLAEGELVELRRQGLFVDRLLANGVAPAQGLALCAKRIPQLPHARLVPADEPLAGVENKMMARWLLRPDGEDVRFSLRSALHGDGALGDYDVVLIDCPPRLTTACINALTVSDYVLIPVLLDHASTEAVPRLLKSLRELRSMICPELAMLGVVANRTYPRAEMIQRERQVWSDLPGRCKDAWGEPVHHFAARIRQHGEFAEAARTRSFAALRPEVQSMFLDLANEIRSRIPCHERC